MRARFVVAAAAAVFLGSTTAHAGVLGGTKSFVLDLAAPSSPQHHRINVESVRIANRANQLDSVGSYHVGDLDAKEVGKIESSLAETLAQVAWPSVDSNADAWALHVVVRHYHMAHSNNDGGVLATVSWAAVAGDAIVFTDDFYVSMQKSDGGKTLGRLKELLNRAIVQRIAETSVRLAGAQAAEGVSPAGVAHTYSTVAEAAAPLPKRLVSFLGLPPVAKKGMDWTDGAPTAPFDWPEELAQR